MEAEKLEASGRSHDAWRRGLFMLLFMIGFGAGQIVLNAMTVAQFLWLLFAGEPNRLLRRFGVSLAAWLRDVAEFQSCAREDKPFPWREWPDGG